MINNYSLYQTRADGTASFVSRYLNIMMLFFPVTAFLLVPVIPGTTIITVLAGILFFTIPLATLDNKYWFFTELSYFLAVILALSFCTQFINLITNLKLPKPLILINHNDFTKTFYRKSHLTQSLPLIVGFIIYGYVKYFSNGSVVKYIYWGLRLLCFYALYEFAFYMLTGQNGDFVANRTFGEYEKSASLFQTVDLGGISMMRIKGYTGEPSMFVFTVFPFWVLSFALKREFDKYLLLTCLVLTFSTTAYACMMLFFGFWVIYKRQFQLFYYMCIAVVVACFVLQLDRFQHLLDSIYNFVFAGKLDGQTASSRDRSNAFITHVSYWSGLNVFSQVFGIGFGYVRSTDFFSTLIVNNGLVGIGIFTWFLLKNLWIKFAEPVIAVCYKAGILLVYIIMMATVPEFAYPSLWIYIALGFVIKDVKLDEEEEQNTPLTTALIK
ncbi:hypothetical protein FFF34_010180 [Inquilinus sp. KBS0705]|nr:hypothetical protein FFF34_010180 [Inquilinus sp. KBS0705]